MRMIFVFQYKQLRRVYGQKEAKTCSALSRGWPQFLIIVDSGDCKYRLDTKPGYLYDLYREYGHCPQAIYRRGGSTMLGLQPTVHRSSKRQGLVQVKKTKLVGKTILTSCYS